MTYQEPTTIAILNGNSLVNRIIESLLEGIGYEVRLLEGDSDGSNEQIFEGIDLVLLAPTISGGFQQTVLTNMRSVPQTANIPVLTLSTTLEETTADKSGFVLWPCRIEELAQHIEAALFTVPNSEGKIPRLNV